MSAETSSLLRNPRADLLAGTVVFLVALPLCLGIAVACGFPPISGLVAGIAGGLIVPILSRSPLSVSGPAAGLTAVVLAETQALGSISLFLTAVIIAGGLQIAFGLLRLGRFSGLVPSAVVKGMLAAIGLTIVIKQLPVAFGVIAAKDDVDEPSALAMPASGTASAPVDSDGDGLTDQLEHHSGTDPHDATDGLAALTEAQSGHEGPSLFGGLSAIPTDLHLGATLIAVVSLAVLFGWKHTPMGKIAWLPAALVVVVGGALAGFAMEYSGIPWLALGPGHFVQVPLGGIMGVAQSLPRPDVTGFLSQDVWLVGFTVAAVASIETLLSLQAVDRLDPLRRRSPPDRELIAQGLANLVSGAIGGLPLTSVIVRSGANVAAGGQDRLSTVFHGVLLLVAVLVAAVAINTIPLACLAAVLLQVGYNLCKPELWQSQYKLGWHQFVPFAVTIVAVLARDLLEGVLIGVVVGVLFVLKQSVGGTVNSEVRDDGATVVQFKRDATFLSKPELLSTLDKVPANGKLVIDGGGEYVDHDVKETLATFVSDAKARHVHVEVINLSLDGVAAGGGH